MNISELITQLNSNDETDRIYAAEDLGLIDSLEAMSPLLQRIVNEPSRKVRETIFMALEKSNSTEVFAKLADLLESEDAFLRNGVVTLFQRKGNNDAAPILLGKMKDPDEDVRKFALEAASGLGHPDVVRIYEMAIADSDLNVVIAAIEQISRNQRQEFKKQVEGIFAHAAQPMLVSVALSALVAIGDDVSWKCIRKRYVESPDVPSWDLGLWISALGNFGSHEDIRLFGEILEKHNDSISEDVIEALERMQERFGSFEISEEFIVALCLLNTERLGEEGRFRLLHLLGGFKASEHTQSFFSELMDHPVQMVRLGAIEGAKRLRTPQLIERLKQRRIIETDPEIIEALDTAL